jgi:hypothetical protein
VLLTISILSLMVADVCCLILVADLWAHPQKIAVMNAVWPITALYSEPLALVAYFWFGRQRGAQAGAPAPRFWQTVFTGTTHCGAGCTLGDIVAECIVFAGGIVLFGSHLLTSLMYWMSVPFHPRLEVGNPKYWFLTQVEMPLGFITSFPANWWLIRRKWKEAM